MRENSYAERGPRISTSIFSSAPGTSDKYTLAIQQGIDEFDVGATKTNQTNAVAGN